MFAIIDSRSSKEVIDNLRKYVEDLFEFETYGITCNSISGHPDIFIYQFIYKDNNQLVIAPNAPDELFEFLGSHNITYVRGKGEVGDDLYNSTQYNCLSTPDSLFHKQGHTDPVILEINKDKEFIPLPQAYTRCSLVHLSDDNYLTSDRGIEKVLLKNGLSSFYFSPEKITIRNHDNGFIGGTIGIQDKKIFFNGNVELHSDGQHLKEHLLNLSFEIINLSDQYLYDGGCIFFV